MLPVGLDDLRAHGLTLCQDADLAHRSKATLAWAKKNGLSLLTLPGNSPDLSTAETMANPLKRAFHAKRCKNEKAGMRRLCDGSGRRPQG